MPRTRWPAVFEPCLSCLELDALLCDTNPAVVFVFALSVLTKALCRPKALCRLVQLARVLKDVVSFCCFLQLETEPLPYIRLM